MQHISCVQWTLDNKYVISGSEEMCLRLWKARASEKLGVVSCLMRIYLCKNILVCFIFRHEIVKQKHLNIMMR
jgi:hypothetical protein